MLQVLEATVRFGEDAAVDGVDLSVADGEVLALLGPSGSGKTTLLRAVAGLQELHGGRVLWNGDDLSRVPPHRRDFGLVFQDFALFPHLDVGHNVGFGLKMQGVDPTGRGRRVSEALRQVELEGFERRRVATLSGGQQQRVALARALAAGPRMLLLDEPLGSLDRALRERLTEDLRSLLSQPGITALYVTHDQSEAFAVADRVAIIDLAQARHRVCRRVPGIPHDRGSHGLGGNGRRRTVRCDPDSGGPGRCRATGDPPRRTDDRHGRPPRRHRAFLHLPG